MSEASRITGMWSTFIMDFLLMLQAYGTYPSPDSQAILFDFNNNGVIDMYDFLQMLANQPPIIKS